MINRVYRAFTEVLTAWHICPKCFDFCLHRIHIDITDNDNSLIIRTVPFVVIITKRLILKVINDRSISYHITLGILRAGIHFLLHLRPDTPICCTAGTPFFANNSTLGINLFW